MATTPRPPAIWETDTRFICYSLSLSYTRLLGNSPRRQCHAPSLFLTPLKLNEDHRVGGDDVYCNM